MTTLPQDARGALRVFSRTPAFTATALLVLTLGIGSNVAVFTVVNALVLKPPGGPAAGPLVGLYARERGRPDRYRLFSFDDYREVRAASQVFSGMLAQRFTPVLVTEGDTSRRSFAALVSANYFETLSVAPAIGRGFLLAEETGCSPVVVVSHAYWMRREASDAVLGRTIRINGLDRTVVGVTPAGFSGTTALLSPEFWLPLGTAASAGPGSRSPRLGTPGWDAQPMLSLVGRLRPGVSQDAAAVAISPLRASRPDDHGDVEIVIGEVSRLSASAAPPNASEVRGAASFLLIMSGIVLLVAALNLANMLLARGAARRREMAIRMAIGATRGRIVCQLVTESLAFSLAGAALGTGLACVGTQMLAATLQPILPMVIALEAFPDWRVLSAAIVFAVVSTVAFGLWPAIRLARTDIHAQLRGGSGRLYLGRTAFAVRNLLVVSQLALSLVLVAIAGVFLKGAWKAADADPGYPFDGGVVAIIDPTADVASEARARDRARHALDRLRNLSGVESASLASSIAFGVKLQGGLVRRVGAPPAEAKYAVLTIAGARYFSTLGVPLLRGREFDGAEEHVAVGRPVIVNETLAQTLWPDADPIGQRVQFARDEGSGWEDPREVIGLVRGVHQSLFDTAPVSQAFVPLAGAPLDGDTYLHLKLRAGGSTDQAMLQRVHQELRAADPRLPVLSVVTLEQHRDQSVYLWIARASAQLFTWFGLAALALATFGVYGVKAFLVAQRTREIGIRVTLGATRADILRLVIADGVGWTTAALFVGLAIALAVSRILASWVYGVGPVELASLAATLTVLMSTSLVACYLPARRAAALPPTVALRQE